MNYVQPRVFDITKERPSVLLVGNGLNRCAGDKTTWDDAIQRLAKDDAILDKIDNINYSIRATVTADADEQKRWARYTKLFGDNFVLPENPLLQKLLAIPFDAVLTTNYTYELENALDPAYPLSDNKETHAFTTVSDPVKGKKPDAVRLLNTFNRFQTGKRNIDIWHIHGEVREPASMILTHEEYGRLVAELVKREDRQQDPTKVCFESWIDYFIYGDLYVLGQGINFAEFDLWWLLSRRQREKTGRGRSIYYAPQQHNKNFTEVEEALDQIGMKVENCRKTIPDLDKISGAECNEFFYKFYETAIYHLKYRIENPIPAANEILIDYRNKCLENQTKTNKIRLLSQLSKTEIYVLGENVRSKVKKTVEFFPIKNDPRYSTNPAMFLFSTKDAYPNLLTTGQELRKMTGLEALDMAEQDPKIEALFLDLQSTSREGVGLTMKQAEYMRLPREELEEYEKAANEKDKARRKINAKNASEEFHLVNCFINNNAFPNTLERAWSNIETMGYFNYEMVLHEAEVQWSLPKYTQVGDIVLFAHTKSAKETILRLLEEQKKTKQYPRLAAELKRALKNHNKYGGKIFAIGQVCELPEVIKPDDPFYVSPDQNHWRSNNFCSVTNIIELDKPVDYDEYKHIVKLVQRANNTPVRGDAFQMLRDVILRNNPKMTFPLYFLKSTVTDPRVEDTEIPEPENEQDKPIEKAGNSLQKQPETEPERPKSSDERNADNQGSLSQILQDAGIEVIDKRPNGGALWIIGGQEIKPVISQCEKLGMKFAYKPGGGKVSQNRDAWWTKDPDPEKS